MKKLLIALWVFLPFVAMAQSEWERPEKSRKSQTSQVSQRKGLPQTEEVGEQAKYLAGAVPMVDGKVVFTLDIDVKDKDVQQIYDIVYEKLDEMASGSNQFEESQVALVNKQEHVIAARFREWLVFKNSVLSLDRSVFNYTIIAKCSDGHLNLTLSRISYAYEMDRKDTGGGFQTSAEEWITDKYALSKDQTKLNKHSGKFRRKTIDRKDEIFELIANALK